MYSTCTRNSMAWCMIDIDLFYPCILFIISFIVYSSIDWAMIMSCVRVQILELAF